MKLVLSLNNKNYLYDYKSMGVDTFVLGCQYSFYAPYIFSLEEIRELVQQHQDVHFYVSVNYLYDQHQIEEVKDFIKALHDIHVYGLIFQDYGVLNIVRKNGYSFDMMYSGETLNTNGNTLNVLSTLGVTSAYLSRVVPLEEQLLIKEKTNIPLMIQCHGVEYIAASKRKLLSNYKDASGKEFDISYDSHLTLLARNSDYQFRIYEDDKGTHIFSKSRLYTLDLLTYMSKFDYLYIETMDMSDHECIEVTSLYSDAIASFNNGKYNKEVKEYLPLLIKLRTPLDRGFLFDSTVYKLEDMRKLDNEKCQ